MAGVGGFIVSLPRWGRLWLKSWPNFSRHVLRQSCSADLNHGLWPNCWARNWRKGQKTYGFPPSSYIFWFCMLKRTQRMQCVLVKWTKLLKSHHHWCHTAVCVCYKVQCCPEMTVEVSVEAQKWTAGSKIDMWFSFIHPSPSAQCCKRFCASSCSASHFHSFVESRGLTAWKVLAGRQSWMLSCYTKWILSVPCCLASACYSQWNDYFIHFILYVQYQVELLLIMFLCRHIQGFKSI